MRKQIVSDGEEGSVRTNVKNPILGVVYPDETRLRTYLEAGEFDLDTMADAFKSSAKTHANRIVLNGPEGKMTARELDQASDRLALALHKLGLVANDRAVFQLPNCQAVFVCLLACFKAQVIPLCTLQAHRRAEIKYLGNHAEAKLHLISNDDAGFDYAGFAREMQECVPSLQHLITVGGEVPEGAHSMQNLIEAQDIKEAEEFVTSLTRDPLQVALFQLSGGSTGIPKIIPRFDYEYLYQLRQVARFNGYTSQDVVLMPTPIVHNANMGCMSLPIMLQGGCYLVLPRLDPKLFFKTLVKHRPTLMGVVGPLLDRFQQLGIRKGFRPTPLGLIGGFALKRLRGVISLNTAQQAETKLGVTGLHVFGMTEGLLMFTSPDDPDEARWHCVGQPVSRFDEVRLVHPSTETIVARGEIGELITRGPYTIRGFYNAPELNADSFTSDGFYRSGDLLSERQIDGQIYYAYEGRIKDVIDRGGEKINAQEIERVLMQHPKILAAALVAMTSKSMGQRACAFVTKRDSDGPVLTLKDMQDFLEAQGVAKFKWPERLEVIDDLPVTKNNKPDKIAMRGIIAEKLAQEKA